jgi:photosystem II stability/assembly factor-like uncharacterized protein
MKSIKEIFLISIILISIHISYAQEEFWEEIDFPYNTDIHCMTMNAQGHIYVGTGSNGGENDGLFRSIDYGETWEQIFYIENHSVYSVALLESGAIIIGTVGTYYLRVSYDNGETWEGLDLPFPNANITTIYPINNDTIYFATGPGNGTAQFIRTYDGGQTFIIDTVMIDDQYTGFVAGIKKRSNGDIYVNLSGYFLSEGGVYKSTDEGETWEYIGLMDHQVVTMEFNSNGEIFTGDWGTADYLEPGIHALYEGSTTFEKVFSNFENHGMAITSEDVIYINDFWGSYYSVDNGENFEYIETELYGGEFFINNDGRLYARNHLHITRSIEPVDYFISIISQPNNQFEVCPNSLLNYSITGEFIDYYQWQKSVDSGVIWEDITENEYYGGTQSDTLWVMANLETANAVYRCKVWDEFDTLYSQTAQLTIETQPPEVECLGNQEVDAAASQTYTIIGTEFDPISITDNCEIASITNNITGTETLDGAILPEGNNTIVWTAVDIANNIAECSFDIYVNPYVGVGENQNNNLIISPNPTHNKFYIKSKIKIDKLNIYELTGKKIRYIEFKKDNSINISDFKNGIYLIEIQTDKQVYFKKILKY